MPALERPTFHEIRSLGGRLYEEQGYKKKYIQALMTHSDEKMTEVYLSGGELSDDQFHRVNADMKLDITQENKNR